MATMPVIYSAVSYAIGNLWRQMPKQLKAGRASTYLSKIRVTFVT